MTIQLACKLPISWVIATAFYVILAIILVVMPILGHINSQISDLDQTETRLSLSAKRDLRDMRPQALLPAINSLAKEKGWTVNEAEDHLSIDIFDGSGVTGFGQILSQIGSSQTNINRAVYNAVPGGSHVEIYL